MLGLGAVAITLGAGAMLMTTIAPTPSLPWKFGHSIEVVRDLNGDADDEGTLEALGARLLGEPGGPAPHGPQAHGRPQEGSADDGAGVVLGRGIGVGQIQT